MIKSIITQLVKDKARLSQLQSIKFIQDTDFKWNIELFFYPEPAFLLFSNGGVTLSSQKIFKARASDKHPGQLYLNAHFKNRRLEALDCFAEGLGVSFSFVEDSESKIECLFEKNFHSLELKIYLPGRKMFRQKVKMAALPDQKKLKPLEEKKTPHKIEKRFKRLIKNVENDFSQAKEELELCESIYSKILKNFDAWGDESCFSKREMQWIKAKISGKSLPSFLQQYSGRSFGLLESVKTRSKNKMFKAQQRLQKLESDKLSTIKALADLVKEKNKNNFPAKSFKSSKKRSPGRWVELSDALMAKVGKNAEDNGDMFRYFKDRDMWFHVKNYPGSHVWIPRGQKLFSKKGCLSEKHILEACQLALFNSKAPRLAKVVVDFTEKRYLRKISGQTASLRIMKSETRMIDWDEQLEKKFSYFKG